MAKFSLTEERKQQNERKCGANRQLVFRGAVAKDEIDHMSGKDVVHLILVFSDQLSFRIFDPRQAVAKKGSIAATLGSLCDALGCDWNDMPACFAWEDFTATFCTFIEKYKRQSVYAKITLNGQHWPALGNANYIIPLGVTETESGEFEIIYGNDKCFSNEQDMDYSDSDMTYLSHSEGDLGHTNEQPTQGSWSDELPPF